eukprot:m51a1_g13721 hypothetical protein (155) ;mRNA; r:106439-107299
MYCVRSAASLQQAADSARTLGVGSVRCSSTERGLLEQYLSEFRTRMPNRTYHKTHAQDIPTPLYVDYKAPYPESLQRFADEGTKLQKECSEIPPATAPQLTDDQLRVAFPLRDGGIKIHKTKKRPKTEEGGERPKKRSKAAGASSPATPVPATN